MPTRLPLQRPLKAEMRYDMTQAKINRINELARKQKAEGLTEEERVEQKQLRKEYIDSFRKSLESQLNSIEILEPDGSITKVEKKCKS